MTDPGGIIAFSFALVLSPFGKSTYARFKSAILFVPPEEKT